MDKLKVKIYVLSDPGTNEIRYVGRTKNSLKIRFAGHLSKARKNRGEANNHKNCWIRSLLNRNIKPNITQIFVVEGWSESYEFERSLITEMVKWGYNLVNSSDKGEGGLMKEVSLEQRKKISETVKRQHAQGLLSCGRKAVDLYDLDGNFIGEFNSYKECAEFIGIKEKNFQCSMQRNAKKVRQYQARLKGSEPPGKWKQRSGPLPANYKTLIVLDTLMNVEFTLESVQAGKDFFKIKNLAHYYNSKGLKLYNDRYKIQFLNEYISEESSSKTL